MKTDFPIKGFHIDLRIQVMPMAALRKFAAELAEFGLNTLLIEWEASYPYQKHAIISNEYAYTRQEVESFVSYCARLGIEVIPLQQCFGHVEYISTRTLCSLAGEQQGYLPVVPTQGE